MPILLALFLVFATVTHTEALEGSPATEAATVKGDVLYWEEGELVVKEISGRQVRLRVTADTKIVGVVSRLKTGDKITAQVGGDGQALSITLQIPDSGAGVILPGSR